MQRYKLAAICGVLLTMSWPGAHALRAALPLYTVEDLGTLNGAPLTPLGINTAGNVVGAAALSDDWTVAFLLDAVPARDIGTLGGARTEARAVNDRDQIAGSSMDAAGVFRAFRYTTATGIQALAMPGEGSSFAFAVNASGQVAGFALSDAFHAFRYTDGAGVIELATPDGRSSYGYGINDAGHVTGCLRVADGSLHAFVWDGMGAPVDLGTLGGSQSCGAAINRAGQVVGESLLFGDMFRHAFRYSPAAGLQDLGSLGGDESAATAINDQGAVVGWSSDATGAQRAFVYTDADGLVDLNTRIDPACGWTLQAASGINAGGQIVGVGLLGGEPRAFRLTPPAAEPEPGDTVPPAIRWVRPSPPFLWPPHGGMMPVRVHVAATDDVDDRPACRVTSVASSEPDAGTSRLDRPQDVVVTGDLTMRLRAELAPGSRGRSYTLDVACADAAGNEAVAQTSILVLWMPWGWFHW